MFNDDVPISNVTTLTQAIAPKSGDCNARYGEKLQPCQLSRSNACLSRGREIFARMRIEIESSREGFRYGR